ncbi:MAG: hypothetical protein D6725_16055 [Planctomycetota bacterium]|nr:MAG: hypothetical protein D6725_16055 [Planctomycetota bacterium]
MLRKRPESEAGRAVVAKQHGAPDAATGSVWIRSLEPNSAQSSGGTIEATPRLQHRQIANLKLLASTFPNPYGPPLAVRFVPITQAMTAGGTMLSAHNVRKVRKVGKARPRRPARSFGTEPVRR